MSILAYDSRPMEKLQTFNRQRTATTLPMPTEGLEGIALLDVDRVTLEQLPDVVQAHRAKADCVLGVTGESNVDRLRKLLELGIDAVVSNHATPEEILRTATVVRHYAERCRHLQQRGDELERKLQDRIILERAKGVLAQRAQIAEDEALRRIRREARNQRRSMREISQEILNIERMLDQVHHA